MSTHLSVICGVLLHQLTSEQKENVKVKSLDKCDFKPMYGHFELEKERKKSLTRDEKKK